MPSSCVCVSVCHTLVGLLYQNLLNNHFYKANLSQISNIISTGKIPSPLQRTHWALHKNKSAILTQDSLIYCGIETAIPSHVMASVINKQVISRPILHLYENLRPKISTNKRISITDRSLWWAIFSACFSFSERSDFICSSCLDTVVADVYTTAIGIIIICFDNPTSCSTADSIYQRALMTTTRAAHWQSW